MKIRTCPFCGKVSTNSPHIYYCKSNREDITKKEIKYLYITHNYPSLNKDLLYKMYISDNKSLPDIVKEFEIDTKSICFLLDYFDIKVRTISDATKMSNNKKIKTCMSKYGVEWYSQTDSAKIAKKRTFTEKYGVDNIWKSDYFKNNLDKYFYIKYGLNRSDHLKNNWLKKDESERLKIIKNWYSKCTYTSGLEKRVKSLVDDIGLEYTANGFINGKSFDIIIDKKIIEVQGDFWHANPIKYKISRKECHSKRFMGKG